MGFTTLVTLVLFMGGVQLVSIGLLGEYLARIYDEVKARPCSSSAGASRRIRAVRRSGERGPVAGHDPASNERRDGCAEGRCGGPAGRPLLPGDVGGGAEEHDVRRDGPLNRWLHLLGFQRLPPPSRERQLATTAGGAARVLAEPRFRGSTSRRGPRRMSMRSAISSSIERERRRNLLGRSRAVMALLGVARRPRLCVDPAARLARRRMGEPGAVRVHLRRFWRTGRSSRRTWRRRSSSRPRLAPSGRRCTESRLSRCLARRDALAAAFLSKLSAPF